MLNLPKSKLIALLIPLCGLWFIGQASYIHAKAVLAQILLEAAWADTLHGEKEVKPWPWADTWPVGRLFVPELGISRIVLAGADGSSLAFGPGHLFNQNTANDKLHIIAGHRDTHFRFLQKLQTGHIIRLQSDMNTTLDYEIIDMLIIYKDDMTTFPETEDTYLLLITCYPFNAIHPGGPLRYIVIARLLEGNPDKTNSDILMI